MNKLNFVFICLTFFFWNQSSAQVDNLRVLWQTDDVFMTPESIVFDAQRDCYYVGNFNDKGGFRDASDTLYDECISLLSTDGKHIDLRWVDGLLGPTGMCIYKDHLYAVERTGVAVVDLKSPAVIKRIRIRDALFLNDICVDDHGNLYISDSAGGTIYRYAKDEVTQWLKDELILKGVNGLSMHKDYLLAGTRGQKGLISISLDKREIEVIYDQFLGGIDGIALIDEGYLLSWLSSIRLLNNKGELQEVWKSDNKYEWCADFYYDSGTKTLLAPTFSTNSVTCFSVN